MHRMDGERVEVVPLLESDVLGMANGMASEMTRATKMIHAVYDRTTKQYISAGDQGVKKEDFAPRVTASEEFMRMYRAAPGEMMAWRQEDVYGKGTVDDLIWGTRGDYRPVRGDPPKAAPDEPNDPGIGKSGFREAAERSVSLWGHISDRIIECRWRVNLGRYRIEYRKNPWTGKPSRVVIDRDGQVVRWIR